MGVNEDEIRQIQPDALRQSVGEDQSLFAFLYGLRQEEFLVSPSQLVAAEKVLRALGERGENNPEQLKTHLAPLFSFSPQQQQLFYHRFDNWQKSQVPLAAKPVKKPDTQVQNEELEMDGGKTEKAPVEKKKWWRQPGFIALLLITIWIVGALLVVFLPAPESPVVTKKLSGEVRNSETKQPIADAEVNFAGQIRKSDSSGKFSLDYEVTAETLNLTARHPEYEPLENLPVETATDVFNISLKPLTGGGAAATAPPPETVPDEQKKIVYEWLLITAAVLPFIIFGLWLLWRLIMRALQLWLVRRKEDEPDLKKINIERGDSRLYQQPKFLRLTREMRRQRRLISNNLEPVNTIEATIRAGNFFTPIYGERRLSPEYLVLIDRDNSADQNARLADEIVARLKKQGVFVERYFFDRDPDVCWSEGEREKFYSLSALAAHYPEDRLLIFSDGDGLINPFSNQPRGELLKKIFAWEIRALFVTNAARSFHVSVLEQFGLPVLEASADDFPNLLEIINTGKAPKKNRGRKNADYPVILRENDDEWWLKEADEEDEREKIRFHQTEKAEILRIDLYHYLGNDSYELLCACAVYPELLWDLTFYFGHRLIAPERREETLENVVCLPWFRRGVMPDWLRAGLLESLPRSRETEIRQTVEQLLISYLQNPSRGFALEIAPQPKSWLSRLAKRIKDWGWKKLLVDFIRAEKKNSPLRDTVFLNFFSGNRLAVRLPRILQRKLRFGFDTTKNWARKIFNAVAILISGCLTFLRVFYRQSNPLLGLSWFKAIPLTATASVLGILALLFLPPTIWLTLNVPQTIAESLQDTALNVEPPFEIPPKNILPTPTATPRVIVASVSPSPAISPAISPSPTISPAASPQATVSPVTSPYISPLPSRSGAPILSPSPPPTITPALVSKLTVSLINEDTKDLITNGRLVVHYRRRTDPTDTLVRDEQFNGRDAITFELRADYYVLIASAPGYKSDSIPQRIFGREDIPLNINLRKIPPSPSPSVSVDPSQCPLNLTVFVSPEVVQPGETAVFTAQLNPNGSNPTYSWSLSGGVILSGEGTQTITVGSFPQDGTYTAMVTLLNVNSNCVTTASASVTVSQRPSPRPVDEYGPLTQGAEKARLDNAALEMQNDPDSRMFIIAYGNTKEIQRRLNFVRNYLVNVRGIDPGRLETVSGGQSSSGPRTQIYIVPPGAEPPVPNLPRN